MNKDSIKNITIIGLFIVIVLLIAPQSITKIMDVINSNKKSNIINNKDQSQQLEENTSNNSQLNQQLDENENYNEFMKVTYLEFKEMVREDKSGYFYVYVGRESCSFCIQIVPILIELQKENQFHFYYLDTDTMTQNEFDDIPSTADAFKGDWGTPTIIKIKNGLAIDHISGFREKDIIEDFIK